jgi:hypothetical protein
LILGDFNAHHTSWSDDSIDQRCRELMEAMDELDLTHLNDGTLTRVHCPPYRGSAVDLSLTSGRTRFDFDWTVLDDSAGSDHNPILINLSGSSNILDWRCYANADNEGFYNMTIESGVSMDDKNRFLIELITQSAKVRSGSARWKFVRLAWWSSECDALNERQMELFWVFRRHEGTDSFNAYCAVNEELTELCEKLKPESFKQYCSTFNCHSSLREMYDMARRYRGVQRRRHVGDFSWLPEFAEKMAPPFVTPKLSFPGRRIDSIDSIGLSSASRLRI